MPSKGAERTHKALQLLGDYLIHTEYGVGQQLRLDFYIDELKLGIEVDGSQHKTFNAHFYDSKDAFKAAQNRDKIKEELCSNQGITLIRLSYDDVMHSKSAEDLLELILERTKEARATTRISKEEDEW